jgi:hypothetical protein
VYGAHNRWFRKSQQRPRKGKRELGMTVAPQEWQTQRSSQAILPAILVRIHSRNLLYVSVADPNGDIRTGEKLANKALSALGLYER